MRFLKRQKIIDLRRNTLAECKILERLTNLNNQIVGDNVGDVSAMELTERQRKIVNLIKSNPYISASQMSEMLSVVKRTIERELAVMKKNGIISREGNARTGRWLINPSYDCCKNCNSR